MATIYKFKAFFTLSGVGAAPSTAPVATIVDTDADSKLATEQATTALVNLVGYYEYEYSGADDLDLVCLFHTNDSSVDQQDLVSYVVEKVYQADAKLDIIDGVADAIQAKTDNLPASPAPADEYDAELAALQADLDNPDQYKANVSGLSAAGEYDVALADIESKIDLIDTDSALDVVLENGKTVGEVLKLMVGALAGQLEKSVSGSTTVLRFRDLADTKDRIVATIDTNKQRISMIYDVS